MVQDSPAIYVYKSGVEMNMGAKPGWSDYGQEKTPEESVQLLFHPHILRYKSHVNWSGIEPRVLNSECPATSPLK